MNGKPKDIIEAYRYFQELLMDAPLENALQTEVRDYIIDQLIDDEIDYWNDNTKEKDSE